MNIEEATARYERWLGRFMPLVRADIEEKHRRMTLGPFLFLRATFYRWCQLWRAAAGDAARASRVLAVGDLHVENFGTWRDADGRLIWGINDFDEATVLPWTQDLVRLAAGAQLAVSGELLGLGRRAAADAILEGYHDGIEAGGPAVGRPSRSMTSAGNINIVAPVSTRASISSDRTSSGRVRPRRTISSS